MIKTLWGKRLFLEERIEAAAGVILLGGLLNPDCPVDEMEEVAEIAPLLFYDALGLGLAALVVSPGAVKRAVQADVQIGPAGRACLLASDFSLDGKLFPAGMTDFQMGTPPSAAMGDLHKHVIILSHFVFAPPV
jgi:hypothetical protein